MMSFGVSFGTHSPYQSEAKKPGSPASSAVGISGDDGSRALPVIAKGLTLPAREQRPEVRRRLDHEIDLP